MKTFIRMYFNNFINFEGRTPRRDYWIFVFILSVIYVLAGTLFILMNSAISTPTLERGFWGVVKTISIGLGSMIAFVYAVLVIASPLPYLAATTRRLRDAGKSPYLLLWLYLPTFLGVLLIVAFHNTFNMVIAFITGVMIILSFVSSLILIILLCLPTKECDQINMVIMEEAENPIKSRQDLNQKNTMTLFQSIKTCFNKYATFSGRASRSEYWWWALFQAIVIYGAQAIDITANLQFQGQTFGICYLISLMALFLPTMAVCVRRYHDSNHSGLWILCPIYNFILLFYKSSPEDNKYGLKE